MQEKLEKFDSLMALPTFCVILMNYLRSRYFTCDLVFLVHRFL